MTTLSDAKRDALVGLGYSGGVNDMELEWLQSLGATANTINDAWREIGVSEAYTTLDINSIKFQYFTAAGAVGEAINDLALDYFANVLPVSPITDGFFAGVAEDMGYTDSQDMTVMYNKITGQPNGQSPVTRPNATTYDSTEGAIDNSGNADYGITIPDTVSYFVAGFNAKFNVPPVGSQVNVAALEQLIMRSDWDGGAGDPDYIRAEITTSAQTTKQTTRLNVPNDTLYNYVFYAILNDGDSTTSTFGVRSYNGTTLVETDEATYSHGTGFNTTPDTQFFNGDFPTFIKKWAIALPSATPADLNAYLLNFVTELEAL